MAGSEQSIVAALKQSAPRKQINPTMKTFRDSIVNHLMNLSERTVGSLTDIAKHPENIVGTGELGVAFPSQLKNLAGTTWYHGTRSPNIRNWDVGYNSWGNKDFKGSRNAIAFSSEPEFAERYAGNEGSIYPVRLNMRNPGNFENPEHRNLMENYFRDRENAFIERAKKQYPDIWTPQRIQEHMDETNARNNDFIRHGAWQKWESKPVWDKFGWDSAFVREDPFHAHKDVLNAVVGSGNQVMPLYQQQLLDLLKGK